MTEIRIPEEGVFVIGSTAKPGKQGNPIFADFIDAPELREIGDRLVRRSPVSHLDDGELRIDYRWKHLGGSSGGNDVLGKCVKLSGAAKHYAKGAHFLVWLAADNCERWGFNEQQLEALVYHELLHITREEYTDRDGNDIVKYGTRGHDVEVFFSELEQYGVWKPDLERLAEVIQPALPGMEQVEIRAERSAEEIARSPAVQKAVRRMVTSTLRPNSGLDSITFSAPGSGIEPMTITREDADRIRAEAK